eukprot:scaffold90695_cov33-Tisochrysis_lutea.AAC.1
MPTYTAHCTLHIAYCTKLLLNLLTINPLTHAFNTPPRLPGPYQYPPAKRLARARGPTPLVRPPPRARFFPSACGPSSSVCTCPRAPFPLPPPSLVLPALRSLLLPSLPAPNGSPIPNSRARSQKAKEQQAQHEEEEARRAAARALLLDPPSDRKRICSTTLTPTQIPTSRPL